MSTTTASSSSAPTAQVISPGPYPLGDDGNWWPFTISVGTTGVPFYVFPNTAISVQYLVLNAGCANQDGNCARNRGNIWNPEESTSVLPVGSFTLQAGDNETTTTSQGIYYSDTVALGTTGIGGQRAGSQLIAGIATPNYWVGYLGLSALPQPVGNNSNTHESLLQSLANSSIIPSASWGYTAGASYQLNGNGPPGSLTLGGFDSSRFVLDEQITLDMNPNPAQMFSVDVAKITLDDITAQSETITMMIDTTFPWLWLPSEACQVFADNFNLTYNSDLNLYGIRNTTYDELDLSTRHNVTMTLNGNDGATTQIMFPYEAFNLIGTLPFLNYTRYFPIRNASGPDQYILGRAFLQQAYLTADFERKTFQIAPALFAENNTTPVIVDITSASGTTSGSGSGGSIGGGGGSNAGAIAGGVVGGIVVILAIIFGIWFYRRRQRKQKEKAAAGQRHSTGMPEGMAELSNQRGSQYHPEDHEATGFVGAHEEERDAGPIEGYYGPDREKAAQQEGHTTDGLYELPQHPVEMDAAQYHEADSGKRTSVLPDEDDAAATTTATGTVTGEASSSSNRGSSEHEKL